MKKIAIQGGFGAFHEMAAKQYFSDEEIEVIPRNTFKDLFYSLNNGSVELGISAIENSIAGSILPNYNHLRDSSMQIIGEIYLRIRQNLLAVGGQKIEDLEEVYSHPMAILQCQDFFDQYPNIKITESSDTALSARKIAKEHIKNVGTIASDVAAENFGLSVLAKGIETNKKNYTRFLILGDKAEAEKIQNPNKSTIHFALAHEIGSLSKVLSILSFYDINLTKIQSMPIIGRNWEYQFYVDLIINNYTRYQQALTAIGPFTSDLGILGEYIEGKSVKV